MLRAEALSLPVYCRTGLKRSHLHIHTHTYKQGHLQSCIRASEAEEPGRLPPRLIARVIATITPHGIITMATSHHPSSCTPHCIMHMLRAFSAFSADAFLLVFVSHFSVSLSPLHHCILSLFVAVVFNFLKDKGKSIPHLPPTYCITS